MSAFCFCLQTFLDGFADPRSTVVWEKTCWLSKLCVLKEYLHLLMEGRFTKNQMSRRRHCEGHAQFHRRKPLKASAQSDSLGLHIQRIFLFFRFPQELLPLILNCLASLSSCSVCFHYANTEPVAGLMFFFTFLDGRRDWGSSLVFLQLALMRNWFLETSSITGRQNRTACLSYRKPQRQSILF